MPEPLTSRDTRSDEPIETLRHSAAHVMAHAICDLFPGTKLAIGPTIEHGFYYDVYSDHSITAEDLPRIEKRMEEIIAEDAPFERQVWDKGEARRFLESRGERFKVEIVDAIEDGTVSFYKEGAFIDLCRGPHLERTGQIKAFKLLSVAAAYWRGDETREVLQRIYGTAFFSPQELKLYLQRLEEAKQRDHRRLGRELDLFHVFEEIGPGLVTWLPKGATVRRELERYWLDVHLAAGYQQVYTPHVAKEHLWETSGHLQHYQQNMFAGIEVEGQSYLLKPMNCPFHIMVYKRSRRSYRELPLRLCEFGTVYRYERSGVLHGLMRVRGFTQDDAHLFCTQGQLREEIKGCLLLLRRILDRVGFREVEVALATRQEDFAGKKEQWDEAEAQLAGALEETGIAFKEDPQGAAFYGPKIDFKIKDVLGRTWQGPTIQLDFNLPQRFDLTYVAEDGSAQPVIMIHRAMFGSLERFLGMLIEQTAGAFPVWLSPVQVQVVPVAERHHHHAGHVHRRLQAAGVRSLLDDRNDTVSYRIRSGQKEKIPYILVIGDKEIESQILSVRGRGKQLWQEGLDAFVARLRKETEVLT